MLSIYMKNHFKTIYDQRAEFFGKIINNKDIVWVRPSKDKWSVGETYYHLYLMVKRIRQLNKIYLPISRKIVERKKNSPFLTYSKDIFTEYKEKKNKNMKAPFMLIPPKGIEDRITFDNLLSAIYKETKYLEKMVSTIEDDVAGHIKYPDPIAHYPNLIQSIHLIAIHEKHHFLICAKYYDL